MPGDNTNRGSRKNCWIRFVCMSRLCNVNLVALRMIGRSMIDPNSDHRKQKSTLTCCENPTWPWQFLALARTSPEWTINCCYISRSKPYTSQFEADFQSFEWFGVQLWACEIPFKLNTWVRSTERPNNAPDRSGSIPPNFGFLDLPFSMTWTRLPDFKVRK